MKNASKLETEYKLQKVRDTVKKTCSDLDWHYHIVPAAKYAKELAKAKGFDEQLAELSGLLHDIGKINFETRQNHASTSVPDAEKILKELNYPQEVIDEVKHCIESHSESKTVEPKTAIAKIVANADAMAHFDTIPILIQLGLKLKTTTLLKQLRGFETN